jgi:uncharacterized integral membrane protein
MGRTKFLLLLLIVVVVAMIFVALNTQSIGVELALFNIELPLGLALIIATALGVVIGVSMRGRWVAELLAERGRLRRALKSAEASARARAVGRESVHNESP